VSWFSIQKPLCAGGRFAANHANGLKFVHAFRLRDQHGHGSKRLTPEIGIQTGYQHPDASIGQGLDDLDNLLIEELGFIDGDNCRIGVQIPDYFE
jgi:hypothetical protein